MTRIAVPLVLVLLSGCSCCNTPFDRRTYVVDDATAMRTGLSDFHCVDECNALAFASADSSFSDAGPPPTVPASNCFVQQGTMAWQLVCYYGAACPR